MGVVTEEILTCLILEDSISDGELMLERIKLFSKLSLDATWVESMEEATRALGSEDYSLIISDLNLPDSDGLETITTLVGLAPQTPIVMITGLDDIEMAENALSAGAIDYMVKGDHLDFTLEQGLSNAVRRHHLSAALKQQKEYLEVLVEKRTRDLQRKNKELQKEIEQRKKAEAHTQTRIKRLRALRTIDLAITNSSDHRLTLEVVMNQAMSTLGMDAARFLLMEPHGSSLRLGAQSGFKSVQKRQTYFQYGQDIAGIAADQVEPLVISDLADLVDSPMAKVLNDHEGFVSYAACSLTTKGGLQGVLELFSRTKVDFTPDWIDFFEAVAIQAAIAVDNANLFTELRHANRELRQAYEETLEGWARALEFRDHETEGHSRRVTELTTRLAAKLDLSEVELVNLRRGALLHDIGKMGIPDSILLKPGKLTAEERHEMEQHTLYGYEMLKNINFLRAALEIPTSHHEKWDGTGYPKGLKGREIPLAARVFAIVDVWDALSFDRPYREAWPQEKVLAHLRENAGTHFDPDIVDAFLSLEIDDMLTS